MKYGFVLPGADAIAAVDVAVAAEKGGWDGYFVWESDWGWDAWALLAAAAWPRARHGGIHERKADGVTLITV